MERIFARWTALEPRGKVAVAEDFKLQRLAVTRYLAGEGTRIPGIRQDKKTLLPLVLTKELRDLIVAGDTWAIKWSLSLLSITRVLLGGKKVDFSSIVDEPTGNPYIISDFELAMFHKKIGRPKLPYLWEDYHWSTKSGPNGPALQGALADLVMLANSPLKGSLQTFYGPEAPLWRLLNAISSPLFQLTLAYFKILPKKLRKLSVKEDKETKSRVFAILDYWSQSALRTLHKSLYKLLRELPADCTFNQTRLVTEFANNINDHSFHSIDLKSATDRFPLDIQVRLLALLTNKDVAESWKQIMVQEEFAFQGKSYKYNCGQPMGAHSSWALFALCHHAIVYIAGLRAGLPNRTIKRCYMLLGDDIVIHHDQVAANYREIMQGLGVEISSMKTHTSKTSFEFAKRWFHQGSEVSPFPIGGLLSTKGSWPLLVTLLSKEVPSRGYETILDLSTRLKTLTNLYPEARRGQQILKRVQIYLSLPVWYKDESSATQALKGLWALVKPSIPFPSEPLRAATLAAQTAYRKEIGKGLKLVKERYQAVYDLVLNFTPTSSPNQEEVSKLTFSLEDVPLLSVIAKITERGSSGLSKSQVEPSWEDFWEQWKEIDITSIPEFNGIIPRRAHERKSGSQAHLALIAAADLTSKPLEVIVEEWKAEAKPARRKGRLARMKEQGILDAS